MVVSDVNRPSQKATRSRRSSTKLSNCKFDSALLDQLQCNSRNLLPDINNRLEISPPLQQITLLVGFGKSGQAAH